MGFGIISQNIFSEFFFSRLWLLNKAPSRVECNLIFFKRTFVLWKTTWHRTRPRHGKGYFCPVLLSLTFHTKSTTSCYEKHLDWDPKLDEALKDLYQCTLHMNKMQLTHHHRVEGGGQAGPHTAIWGSHTSKHNTRLKPCFASFLPS